MASRKAFLASAGSALVIVATQSGCGTPHAPGVDAPRATLSPSAWLRVTPSDRVEVLVGKSEMGQGVATGFATIVARELGSRIDQIDVVFPPADEKFDDPVLHTMLTGGSLSMANMWAPLRNAGAAAAAMLVAAAANRWGVDAASCAAARGEVTGPKGLHATFGELAAEAALLPVSSSPIVRDAGDAALDAEAVPRLDLPAKTRGAAKFGIDVVLPGMQYATVVHAPVFGATLASLDDAAARRTHGVLDVVPISSGVAVLATNTWSALAGARALKLTWHDPAQLADTAALFAEAETLAADPARRKVAARAGDASVRGAQTVRARFRGPFLAHASLEPMNATAFVAGGRCVVYAPTQVQTAARAAAAKAAGVSFDAVELHTTLIGGGFGRRLHADYVREAVEIAAHARVPVKLTWTREEDLQHDYYRPMFLSDVRAEIDADGRLSALEQTVVTPSILRLSIPEYSGGKVDGEFFAGIGASWDYVSNLYLHGFDEESVRGAYDSPYRIPNLTVAWVEHATPVPVGDMRAPGANWNTFVLESIVDECAFAAKRNPAELRRELLVAAPRGIGVLDRVVAMSGFGSGAGGAGGAGAARGRALGLGFVFWLGSYAATVADVSLDTAAGGGAPKVHRLWIAADVGRVINPDIVAAQLQGGAIYGLSMALKERITLAHGRVEQSNFYDYHVVKMADAPAVEVSIVPSSAAPTGVGELGVPGVAPAVANALFALTGRRTRELPFPPATA